MTILEKGGGCVCEKISIITMEIMRSSSVLVKFRDVNHEISGSKQAEQVNVIFFLSFPRTRRMD